MTFDKAYFSIGYLDRLSYQNTFIHRLDPRTKVVCTLLFLLSVISYPKYDVAELLPFFLFPVILMTLGDIPLWFVVKKVLTVSPFAIFVGIFNPFLDKNIYGLRLAGYLEIALLGYIGNLVNKI